MSSTTVDSSEHIHAFGEWKVETPASCTAAGVEIRECECGEKETREGDAATGHTAVSIRAVCDKTDTMKYDVLSAEDFTVTATCGCGATYIVTEGITIENGTLAIGENTVTELTLSSISAISSIVKISRQTRKTERFVLYSLFLRVMFWILLPSLSVDLSPVRE